MLLDKSYKVSAFGDFSDIDPTQENMEYMLEQFGKRGLLPSIFQEIVTPNNRLPLPVQRIALISNDSTKQVVIASNRVDFILQVNSDKKLSDEEITKINQESKNIFADLFNKFNKKSNRLALNTESFIVELDNEELKNFMSQFKNPVSIYNGILDEWNIRMMIRQECRIRDKAENANIITEISRGEFLKKVEESIKNSTGFSVFNDINTVVSNQKRFDAEDLYDFSIYASKLWRKILDDINTR
ncbi:MAG: hypothetical protein IJS99_03945 [Synergistaceae bacterium]|nr:hypothetical protein [Synergistaceae bacterium]